MKLFAKIGLGVLILLVILSASIYLFFRQSLPVYDGEIQLQGLHQNVDIHFDDHGIPHIYAENEEDAYFALGYVHAQERLFQMELIRRVAQGRLSEILGPDLLETDKLFRSIGIHEMAKRSKKAHLNEREEPWQKAAYAYLDGVNQFVEHGSTPPEFSIMGIEKTPFTPEDLYDVTGYMAFGFAVAWFVDPIADKVMRNWGKEYLADWVMDHDSSFTEIMATGQDSSLALVQNIKGRDIEPTFASHVLPILKSLPISPFIGSNSWVLAPSKTTTGQVIFANDPHIGYSQPAVWYEAHIEAPGFSFYGYHLAGNPFAPLGHSKDFAIGITMFENDDVDFYREKRNPENPDQFMFKGNWKEIGKRTETIQVKGGEDVVLTIETSEHGPVVNSIFKAMDGEDPISMSWTYLKAPSELLEISYKMGHAKTLQDVRKQVSRIQAPGLNIMYGDNSGNIAWWAAAAIPRYPEHVNTKLILDGTSGRDEPLGYYGFSLNPQSENPASGYVYSANNQPSEVNGVLYPGYYSPPTRPQRIVELLEGKEKWSVEDVKDMLIDGVGPTYVGDLQEMLSLIEEETSSDEGKLISILKAWKGEHDLSSIAPTVYYKWIYHIMHDALADELGEADFEAIKSSFLLKRTTPVLIKNDRSPWWDNVNSPNTKETRKDIVFNAFNKSMQELREQHGKEYSKWTWKKVHTIEHPHVLGNVPLLRPLFNVGPFGIGGGNETINNVGFPMGASGLYPSDHGPSRRAIVDFSNIMQSPSILTTGQSGHFMSPFYDDQASMYTEGAFRPQRFDRSDILNHRYGTLRLIPNI